MRTAFLIFIIVTVCAPQLWAQQYLTIGMGYSGAFFGSDDLNHFKETYNWVNAPSLFKGLRGFAGSVGLRWEIGYRYLNRLSGAVLVGIQTYENQDMARYFNGEARELQLEIKSLYIEGEIGKTYKSFFVNGLFVLFFNRRITLKSEYDEIWGEEPKSGLDGTYEGLTSNSADLGISFGFFKDPFLLTLKVTYPLYTGGRSSVLRKVKSEKSKDRVPFFPSDYEAFLYGDAYHGVSNNIDGLKILVTGAFAMKIKK
jgi:hypothetical protein